MSQGVSCGGTFWHVARIPEVYACCWDIIKDVGWSAFFGLSGYSWISSVWYVRSKMVIDLPWLIWVSSIPCVVPLYWIGFPSSEIVIIPDEYWHNTIIHQATWVVRYPWKTHLFLWAIYTMAMGKSLVHGFGFHVYLLKMAQHHISSQHPYLSFYLSPTKKWLVSSPN